MTLVTNLRYFKYMFTFNVYSIYFFDFSLSCTVQVPVYRDIKE